MGWNYDYTFNYLKQQTNQKSKMQHATKFLAISKETLMQQ